MIYRCSVAKEALKMKEITEKASRANLLICLIATGQRNVFQLSPLHDGVKNQRTAHARNKPSHLKNTRESAAAGKPVGSEQSMPANGNLRSKGKARARIPSPEPALSDEDIEHACNDDTHQLSRKSFLSTHILTIRCME